MALALERRAKSLALRIAFFQFLLASQSGSRTLGLGRLNESELNKKTT